jgi:SAM-dependent methyltransferase
VDVYRDREVVRREYASEERLLARASIYAGTGRDSNDVLIETIAEHRPGDVLEVGCGPGLLAERLRDERDISVIALDSSERMVALTRARGIDARLGDVQALAFADDSFDVVIAAWMLYHVTDLDHGLREIARVLRPGGTLIATTNSERHLAEMWMLVGLDGYPLPFNAENGARILGRHFAHVDQQDISGTVNFPDREAIRRYVASSIKGRHLADRLPDSVGPLSATWRCCILSAAKAAPA